MTGGMEDGQKADPIFELKARRAERKTNAPCESYSETLPR